MRYVTDDGVTFNALAPDEPLLVDGSNDVNEPFCRVTADVSLPGMR